MYSGNYVYSRIFRAGGEGGGGGLSLFGALFLLYIFTEYRI